MADPLKFILDLDAKIGGNIRGLTPLLTKIEKGLLRIDPGLRKTAAASHAFGAAIGGSMRIAGKAIGMLSGQVARFTRDAASSFLGYASFAGLTALAKGTISAGAGIIRMAGQAEDMDRILKTLGGPEMAGRIQALSAKIGKRSPIDGDYFNELAAGLLKVGFSMEQIRGSMALAGDIAALTPGDAAAKAQAFLAVGEALEMVAIKGALSIKQLNKIGVTKDDFFAGLGLRLGKSAATAEEMATKGQVSVEKIRRQMIESVGNLTGKAPGAAMVEAGLSPLAQFDRFTRIPEELAKGLAGSPALKVLGEQFMRIADIFDPESAQGKRIIGGIEKMMGRIADTLGSIDVDKLSTNLTNLFTRLPGLIDATTRAGLKLIEVVDKLSGGRKTAEPTKLPRQAPTLLDAFNPKSFPSMSNHTRMMTVPPPQKRKDPSESWLPRSVAMSLNGWEDLFFGAGSDGGKGMAEGLQSQTPAIDAAARSMATVPIDATREQLQARSPSKVFRDLGQNAGGSFALGLEESAGRIRRATQLPAPTLEGGGLEGARGGGRSITITAPVTINYSGPAGPAAARDLAAMVGDLLPGHLQALFDRMRLQTGGA